MLHIFNIFRENDGKENCAQVLEEDYKIFGTKFFNDEHDCNVVSVNSLSIHDANDMQSYKLGDAIFDEYDISCPQVLLRIFVTMKACLLFMMIILMKVDLERS